MKTGIRAKLLAVLLLSSLLPLVLGVLSLQFFGARYYRQNQGLLFQGTAGQVAQTLGISANTQAEKLSDWIVFLNLPTRTKQTLAPVTAAEKARSLDARWGSLDSNAAPLTSVLNNGLAIELGRFIRINPIYSELLVTDKSGFLVAASSKPTDYIQSDEVWWKSVRQLPASVASLNGMAYDASSKTYTLDVAFAMRDEKSNAFLGAIKGSVNVSKMYLAMPRGIVGETIKREIVLSDGRILSRLDDPTYPPLRDRYEDFSRILENQRNIASQMPTKKLNLNIADAAQQGWAVAGLNTQNPRDAKPPEDELVGFAALGFASLDGKSVPVAGMQKSYIVVHQKQSEVLAPVRNYLWGLGLVGGALTLVLATLGFWLAERVIVAPLRVLSAATRDIARTANFEPGAVPDVPTRQRARSAVAQCRKIGADDEISTLAQDFAQMGEQILNYHDRLETEIAEKAGEILRDLEMAREFQGAMVPREHPEFHPIALSGAPMPLNLSFHHIYRAAHDVGSDLYDVFKISEHQAGIFQADVLEHGTRSALVTTVLRTLLLDFSKQTSNPAELMRLINRHFYEIAQSSHQTIVASAFCLIIDTRTRLAIYANAGHPSPLFAQAQTARVLPLLGHSGDGGIHTNAMLGAASDTTYRCYEREISPGDAFLIYTDGVVNAPNPDGDEFGMTQLEQTVSLELARTPEYLNVGAICQTVIDAVDSWTQNTSSPDDICMVAIGTDTET